MGWTALVCIGALAGVLLSVAPPDLAKVEDRSPEVVDADGAMLRPFAAHDGRWRLATRAEEASPLYLRMLLAYEDRNFARHPGIDPLALLRASWQWLRYGRPISGASTITMQTARLLEPGEHSLFYKLRQLAKALALERHRTKQQILDIYLTMAPFGGNLEGVRAAAWAYFGKEPLHLTPAEAALLVALPQAPSRRPDRHPESARQARDRVLQRMLDAGVLKSEVVSAAMREPVPSARRHMPAIAPHLAQQMLPEARRRGRVQTTINQKLQQQLAGLIDSERARLDPAANVAILVVRNSDRAVLAHVGSASLLDDERAGEVNFVRAVRSPGSTLKPFIYGLAFEGLIVHPDTLIKDEPARYGQYVPTNFEGEYGGWLPVRDALRRSLNTTAVALMDAIGPARFLSRLRAAGVGLQLTEPDADAGLSIAVGGCGISLESLTTLYVGLANGGVIGRLRYSPEDPVTAGLTLLSRDAAWAVADILAEMRRPGAPAADLSAPRRIAYKTGTSAAYRDAWSVGFDAEHTVGIWVGRPDAAPMPGRFGRVTAAPLLFRVFDLLPEPLADPAGSAPVKSPLKSRPDLPPRLVRFEPRPARETDPVIDTPADGAELIASAGTVFLRGRGGRPPYRWFVDGRPIGPPTDASEVAWQPRQSGGFRLDLVDETGRSATATIWFGGRINN